MIEKDDNRKLDEMVVYTRTGDKGKTSLFDSIDVYKDNKRVECYGTIDELNSFIAIAKHHISDEKVTAKLHKIQRKLFDVGAELATVDTSILATVIVQEDIDDIEREIDHYLQYFEPPKFFIIPGDNVQSAYLHICRTVCRRAERLMVKLAREEDINELLVKYVNRLSDLFYTYSRYVEDNYENVVF